MYMKAKVEQQEVFRIFIGIICWTQWVVVSQKLSLNL